MTVPEWMQNSGVDSGWGLFLIFLVVVSAYLVSLYSEPSLILPQLVKAFVDKNSTDTTISERLAWKLYSWYILIIASPIVLIIPVLVFLCWSTSNVYEGCSIAFVTMFWFLAILALLALKSTFWSPHITFHRYSFYCSICFIAFVVTQLFGSEESFTYSVNGTMYVGISAVPIIVYLLLSSETSQRQVLIDLVHI